MAGDAATLWQLMSGGLSHLPSTAALGDWLVETAWNEYQTTDQQTFVGGNGPDGSSYLTNNTGAGGMDTTQATPAYQEDYGLTSAIYAALGLNGRALPDVVAPAGGNMFYSTPGPNMEALVGEGGTSAATPFWASLITQINYVFNDQGLPNLGYMTDLLYLASVIAPGSFNDVTMGNNTSSFSLGGADYGGITPTGYGYEAGTGYDLASGLGSPNGLLLARALTEIAHSQLYFSATPDVIDANAGGWTSGTAQTLLLQTTASADATATVTAGGDSIDAGSAAHAAYAWTSQLAQQSLQSDFDGDLLALFDGQTQGSLTQAIVAGGESLSVTFNGAAAVAAQANLSASFGFADFFSDATNSVAWRRRSPSRNRRRRRRRERRRAHAPGRGRRPLADALQGRRLQRHDRRPRPRPGRLRSRGGGPGLCRARRRHHHRGPGDGNAGQAQITGVDAGDLIAMQLTNVTNGDTFWAFSQANEWSAANTSPICGTTAPIPGAGKTCRRRRPRLQRPRRSARLHQHRRQRPAGGLTGTIEAGLGERGTLVRLMVDAATRWRRTTLHVRPASQV